jgi:hypothetical protein
MHFAPWVLAQFFDSVEGPAFDDSSSLLGAAISSLAPNVSDRLGQLR